MVFSHWMGGFPFFYLPLCLSADIDSNRQDFWRGKEVGGKYIRCKETGYVLTLWQAK